MNNISCKYCQSPNVVKFGTFQGIQRYWCKDCKRKFADNRALPTMKTPIEHISTALSCYFGGMPLDAIQRHLQQKSNAYYTEMGIYNWIRRFSQEAIDRVKHFQPVVGNTWITDETVLKELRRKTYTQVAVASSRGAYADKDETRLLRRCHRGWKRIY